MRKVCNKCNEEKDTGEFYKRKASKDGFQSFCKQCKLKVAKTKEYADWRKGYRQTPSQKEYARSRRDNISYRVQDNMSRRIRHAITKGHFSTDTEKLLGCSYEELMNKIKSQWKEGMSWDNYGHGNDKWHMDHIRPCCSFDLTDEEQVKECFHHSNLQPMWQPDNIKKGSKW